MAYFLGRDIKVAITTELTTGGVCIDTDDSNKVEYRTGGAYNANDVNFAGPRGDADTEIFGSVDDDGGSVNYSNEVSDLVGCDLGIGVTDEDITYLGQKSVLKAEIKKETTISLTRKKNDNTWDLIFNNGGRYGLPEDVSGGDGTDLSGVAAVGYEQPDFVGFGYRVFIQLKNGTEIFAVPNCCITGHTVTLNADGTTEETLELMSYVAPKIGAAETNVRGASVAADL